MADRARDWLAQAEKDLEHAQASARDGRHDWACFAAQQAAEKAVRGLHLRLGQEAWGHVVARLLRELPRDVPETLVEKGSPRQLLRPEPLPQRPSGRGPLRTLWSSPERGSDPTCP